MILGYLEHRNTPDELASPNEKLMSRRTRTVLPVKAELLEPHVIPTKNIIKASVKKKQQNKRYYDQVSRPLPALVVGEHIRSKIKPSSSRTWTQGTVVRKENNRSYIVEANGREYRRNRFHIRKSGELSCPQASVPEPPVAVTTNSDAPVQIPKESVQQPVQTTKNTRVSRRPKAIKYRATAMIATVETNDTENSQTPDCTTRRSQRLRKPNPKVQNFELYS